MNNYKSEDIIMLLNEVLLSLKNEDDSMKILGEVIRISMELQLYLADRKKYIDTIDNNLPIASNDVLLYIKKYFKVSDDEVEIIDRYLNSEEKVILANEEVDEDFDKRLKELIDGCNE